MSGIRPKQFARLGEYHLEEAILDVLLEAAHEDQCIGAAEISRRAGIYRKAGAGVASGNDFIVTGMLNKLAESNKVERCDQAGGKGGWKLTNEEFHRRRDDIHLE